eukprot:1517206-Alexandrium_andersonii.AAC.1
MWSVASPWTPHISDIPQPLRDEPSQTELLVLHPTGAHKVQGACTHVPPIEPDSRHYQMRMLPLPAVPVNLHNSCWSSATCFQARARTGLAMPTIDGSSNSLGER